MRITRRLRLPSAKNDPHRQADFRFKKKIYLSVLLEQSWETELMNTTIFGEESYRFWCGFLRALRMSGHRR